MGQHRKAGYSWYELKHAGGDMGENIIVVKFYPERVGMLSKHISELADDLDLNDEIEKVKAEIRERPLQSRIDVIGQNGGDGLHYKSKYHREIKPGVWIDVYDVLNAFGVKCHALAHAIKKLLMCGERGAKNFEQDAKEAKQSIDRSIDHWC